MSDDSRLPSTPDALSKAGAEFYAARIRQFWLDRGYDIKPLLHDKPLTVKGNQARIWTVELPGFRNGMPPKSARIQNAA